MNGKMYCILHVEDDETARELFKRSLKKLPVVVMNARDGQEALDKMNAVNFDLVVTDIVMPKMDGLEFLKELQAYEVDKPVMVLTGFRDDYTLFKSMSFGVKKIMYKPYKPEDLRRNIQELLKETDTT